MPRKKQQTTLDPLLVEVAAKSERQANIASERRAKQLEQFKATGRRRASWTEVSDFEWDDQLDPAAELATAIETAVEATRAEGLGDLLNELTTILSGMTTALSGMSEDTHRTAGMLLEVATDKRPGNLVENLKYLHAKRVDMEMVCEAMEQVTYELDCPDRTPEHRFAVHEAEPPTPHMLVYPAETAEPLPLTFQQQAAFDLIAVEGPIMGEDICRRVGIKSLSTFTSHYVPALKDHGVRNRRGAGYYLKR